MKKLYILFLFIAFLLPLYGQENKKENPKEKPKEEGKKKDGFPLSEEGENKNTDPLEKISLYLSHVQVRSQDRFALALEINIQKGFHFYGYNIKDYNKDLIPTSFTLKLPPSLKTVKIIYAKPLVKKDPNLNQDISFYEGTFKAFMIFEVQDKSAPAKATIEGTLDYQACNELSCFPQAHQKFSVTLEIVDSKASISETGQAIFQGNQEVQDLLKKKEILSPSKETSPKETASIGSKDDFSSIFQDKGLFIALLYAFFWGLLSAFLPCIYPLIPVTISYFTAQSKGSVSIRVLMGFFYMMGIILTFSLLSLVATLALGKAAGSILGNWYFIQILFLFFLALALSMFGLFEIRLPDALTDRLQGSQKGGLMGAFFMGSVLGLVAAPCVAGPFATILVFAIQGGIVVGTLATLAYGLGIGIPFMALAIFSSSVRAIPKAGEWMERIKMLMGFLMLGVGVYFEANSKFIEMETAYLLYGILTLMSAVFIGAFDNLTAESSPAARWSKGMGLVMALVGCYLIVGALVQKKILFENSSSFSSNAPAEKNEVKWSHSEEAVKAPEKFAQKNQKNTFIFFSAVWCTYCQGMKKTVFKDPQVLDYIEQNFIPVYADIDTLAGAQDLKNKLVIAELPGFAFYSASGKYLGKTGKEDTAGFLKFMKEMVEKSKQ